MPYVGNMGEAQNFTFGYARVSTEDQSASMQVDALRKAGVSDDCIYVEKASGGTMSRPVLARLLKKLRSGDTLIIWKLDRLGRTVLGVLEAVEKLDREGVTLKSLRESIDTKSPIGRAVLSILATMAQLERDMVSERTRAGMEVAKAQGAKFGKAHYIRGYPKRLARFEELFRDPGFERMTVHQIVDELNRADRRAPKITSLETYRAWKRKGWPGAILHDVPLDDETEAAE